MWLRGVQIHSFRPLFKRPFMAGDLRIEALGLRPVHL